MKVEKIIEQDNKQYLVTLSLSSTYDENRVYFTYSVTTRDKGKRKWLDTWSTNGYERQKELRSLYCAAKSSKIYEYYCADFPFFKETIDELKVQLAEEYKKMVLQIPFQNQ